jgi:hypothetical protein
MIDTIFGKMTFATGWIIHAEITLWKKSFPVVIKAKAYYEEDGITSEQEKAFVDYKNNATIRLTIPEILLAKYANGAEQSKARFIPKVLLFNRDGSYSLLFDDTDDLDGGVAVCLSPDERIVSQDEYL